ncbi:phage tail protein [Streptomyces netropsis]
MKAGPEKATTKERGIQSGAAALSARATESVSAPVRGGRGLDRRGIQRLQGAAGNAAVSRLVAQRYAEVVAPPPAQAPGFREVTADVAAKKQTIVQHPPAAGESKAAQDAAVAPPDDKQAQGKAAQAEKMNAAKPGEFDKAAFIKAVNDAIAAQAPKNLDEADKFADSGKADKVREQVEGKVGEGKESSAEDIETTTKAAPDTSAAQEKQVTPMTPDKPPGNPGPPNADAAIPAKQPDAVTDFSEGPKENDKALADAEITEDQLAKGNEPEFDQALSEKKKAEEHSAQAPAQGRAAESRQLTTAKANAAAAGTQAMASLTATRTAAGQQVDGGKSETKSKDERKRAEVTARLQKVFDDTKKDVEGTLSGLDKTVDDQFTRGEKAARDAFMADQERRMKAYKKKRYSGFTGKLKWVKDKFKGLPEAANQLYQESRKLYVQQMQGVISGIADTIGAELGAAKARIAKGRAELKAEVDRLPADLRQFGEEAATDFAGKFDDLESEVNEKSQQLVQELATKYTQALNKIDEEIKKLQEANKGLIDKAKDAIVGVIKTINELKNLLMGILAKAAGAIMKIIKDPIGFLGNLVQAVGAGLNLFITNIADHLEKGLVSWLLGTAVKAGLELPPKFDLKGIIHIIGSLLGLTWDNIRARVVRKGVPDAAMSAVEQQVPVAQSLQREGPAGASKEISAQAGDLKGSILQKLKSYLIPTVLIAGITWIVSLLNPASAFVRAVKGIIDIVTFIVNQGAQVVDFVNAVLDAVVAIANGAKAGVPKMVETALAASVPLLIGFLAALVGVGGLANKVKQVFHAVARPVNRAIDKIVDFLAKAGKKLWAKLQQKKGGQEKSTNNPNTSSDRQTPTRDHILRIISNIDTQATFTTFGHEHTIGAKGSGTGRLITTLASNQREEFKEKVSRVKTALQSYPAPRKVRNIPPGDMVDRLRTSIATEARLKESFGAWKRQEQARNSPDPAAANRIKQLIDNWLLQGRPEVVDESDIPRLPEGYNKHRDVLYEGNETPFNRAKIAVIARDFPAIFDAVQAVIKPYKDARTSGIDPASLRMIKATAVSKLRDMTMEGAAKDDAKVPVKILKEFKRKGDVRSSSMRTSKLWNVDHIVPLSAHWHAAGYNSKDEERTKTTPEVSNLQLIAGDANKSAQGDYEGEKYEFMTKAPGPDFETEKKVWD